MTPSGVRSYSHKAKNDDGKFHPSSIASGLETVEKQGGSPPPAASSGKGSTNFPKNVVKGNGTESLKGTKVVKKRGERGKVPYSGSTNYPGNVRKHSGLKAPHSGKQPK